MVIGACCGAIALSGCERKERVLDVKTPHENVTVDRNIDTGKIEIEAKKEIGRCGGSAFSLLRTTVTTNRKSSLSCQQSY